MLFLFHCSPVHFHLPSPLEGPEAHLPLHLCTVYTQETRCSSLGLHSAASVDSCLTACFFPWLPRDLFSCHASLGRWLMRSHFRTSPSQTAPGSSPLMYHVKTSLWGMGFSSSHQMKHPCAGGCAGPTADAAVDQTKAWQWCVLEWKLV